MEQTFDFILTSLLKAYESNSTQNIDEWIAEQCKDANLPEELVAMLKETNMYINAFSENATSLEKAKVEEKSRKRWILEKLDCIMEERSEEEKAQVISTISETNEKMIEETTAKE